VPRGLADDGPGLFVVPGGDVARVAEDAFVGPLAEGDRGDELAADPVRRADDKRRRCGAERALAGREVAERPVEAGQSWALDPVPTLPA
jgi:hypothetical protein